MNFLKYISVLGVFWSFLPFVEGASLPQYSELLADLSWGTMSHIVDVPSKWSVEVAGGAEAVCKDWFLKTEAYYGANFEFAYREAVVEVEKKFLKTVKVYVACKLGYYRKPQNSADFAPRVLRLVRRALEKRCFKLEWPAKDHQISVSPLKYGQQLNGKIFFDSPSLLFFSIGAIALGYNSKGEIISIVIPLTYRFRNAFIMGGEGHIGIYLDAPNQFEGGFTLSSNFKPVTFKSYDFNSAVAQYGNYYGDKPLVGCGQSSD